MFTAKLSFFLCQVITKKKKNSNCEPNRVLPWIPSVATVSVIDVHSCHLNELSHHHVRGQ